MAILNPGQGQLVLPEVMWALVRYLSSTQNCSREQLLFRVSPDALRASGGTQSTLRWMLDTDLLVEATDGRIEFGEVFVTAPPKTEAAFKRGLRESLFGDPRNDALIDDTVQDRGLDLVRGLCWLLAQDPVTTVWNWASAQTSGAEKAGAGAGPTLAGFAGRMIVNDTRWNMFVHWAHYMGFAERWTIGRGSTASMGVSLISSPARAVADAIVELWTPGVEVPAEDFCARILDVLPVIPGGRLSQSVGSVSDTTAVHPTLSYAMLVHSFSGLLAFADKSDASGTVLLDLGHEDDRKSRRISSVTIGKAKRG